MAHLWSHAVLKQVLDRLFEDKATQVERAVSLAKLVIKPLLNFNERRLRLSYELLTDYRVLRHKERLLQVPESPDLLSNVEVTFYGTLGKHSARGPARYRVNLQVLERLLGNHRHGTEVVQFAQI